MPCTTFINDAVWDNPPDVAIIREWLPEAKKALGNRIAVEEREFVEKRWLGLRQTRRLLYMVLTDLGCGEAQIINFAPRNGSSWTINHYVPAQEVAAWLMGIVAGSDAALTGEGK